MSSSSFGERALAGVNYLGRLVRRRKHDSCAWSLEGARDVWQAMRRCWLPPWVNTVNATVEALEAEALRLSPADRSLLLERIAVSLELDPEIEEAWDREADRREAQIADGSVQLVPGEEALARPRAKLR